MRRQALSLASQGACSPARFQVGGCASLGFKPKLCTRLFGGTGAATTRGCGRCCKPAPGDANIARASVTLPRSEFLDQAHIRTICTRVQFAADACPKGSIYGCAGGIHAAARRAAARPGLPALLQQQAARPGRRAATARSTSNLVGRIDTVRGGIRNTFDGVPDAPVSKFVLNMQGGKRGLLVN